MNGINQAFARHTKAAFQFSGGRDSTAALYLLRPWWHLMTVYHLNTGDRFPETTDVVRRVAKDVAIVEVDGNVHAIREKHGWPSDVVPADNVWMGRALSGRTTKIIGRFDCCFMALMKPMHDRMHADGITLIVRGQRNDEFTGAPLTRSGHQVDGFEFLYPIEDWTAGQVDAFIAEQGLPVAPFYAAGLKRAPDCMGCTAWWDEGRGRYLADHHPEEHAVFKIRSAELLTEVARQINTFDDNF